MGPPREVLHRLAGVVAKQLRTAAWPRVLPSIINAVKRDTEVAAMQAALHEGNMAPFHSVIERARARGPVWATKPAADMIAAVLRSLFHRRWFSKEEVGDAFVDRVIADAVDVAVRVGTRPSPNRRPGSRKPLPAVTS